MKSNTYELHNYADLDMELDSDQPKAGAKDSRKRKASTAAGNRRGEKYSLRQKRQRRTPGEPVAATSIDPIELQPAAKKPKNSAKTKAPPLSKYRRKTANARERTRMREINMAFEQLRHCVPQTITGEDAANANEKLTKITTLRMAMKYIGMLSESLQDPSYESDFLVECLRESASREAHVSRDTELEPEPELDLELELEPAKPKKPAKASKKTPAKRPSKAAKGTPAATPILPTAAAMAPSSSPESCYASSSLGSPAFCAAACSSSSAYASLSSAASSSSSSSSSKSSHSSHSSHSSVHSLLGVHALSELNSLLMESDSDSLHCLNSSYHQELLSPASALLPARGDLPMSMDKPDVELSLRLLDQSTDSFDFASDQQPSACISPLATLDSFHPFADLLHGEFPDIFLT